MAIQPFSVLDGFEPSARCLAPHSGFGSAVGHGCVSGKKEHGESSAESFCRALEQQTLSHSLSLDLLPFPAACPIPLDIATTLDYSEFTVGFNKFLKFTLFLAR